MLPYQLLNTNIQVAFKGRRVRKLDYRLQWAEPAPLSIVELLGHASLAA